MCARSLAPPATPAVVAARARSMRFSPTSSEEALWRAIRSRRLGVQFRRQVPIGRFIVDFLATKERLVVEVDGGYHEQRRRTDARRDENLRRWGYRVLRLEAELVMRKLPVAVERIRGGGALARSTLP